MLCVRSGVILVLIFQILIFSFIKAFLRLRLCQCPWTSLCTSGQVEDEIHYLLHCTYHANHREIFTTYLTSECQNFQNLIKWNKRSAPWMTCIEHEKENIPFGIVPWCSLLVIQKLGSLSMFPTILHVCVSLPFPSTWKFFCINMASLQLTQVGFYSISSNSADRGRSIIRVIGLVLYINLC